MSNPAADPSSTHPSSRSRLNQAINAQREAEAERDALRALIESRASVIEGFNNTHSGIAAEHQATARALRRDLEDHDFEFPRVEHARVDTGDGGLDTITVPRPCVPFGPKGVPQDVATANYLGDVIEKIDGGYAVVGGSNVTATVRKLLADVASALHVP